MSGLLERVEDAIRTRGLLKRRQSVMVGVSGGLDSMVLLRLLWALSRRYSWNLTVAHLNHQLRGRSSDADEQLVIRAARKLHLPVVVERADVRGVARLQKLSVEMAARKVRHDFLARAASRLKIHSVALAHHADDQIELFFLRLLRGSGGGGLAGMKWLNASPSDPNVALIRPLLGEAKAELREYAKAANVAFRQDASNARLDIQRNRIRHELLPLLRRKYQPAIGRTILRIMDITGAEAELVSRLAAEWLSGKHRAPFAKLPRAVQRRCIQLQLLENGVPTDYDLVERLRLSPGRKVTISPELAIILTPQGGINLVGTTQALKRQSASRQAPAALVRVRTARRIGAAPHPGKSKLAHSPALELSATQNRLKVELRSNRGKIEFGGLEILWRIGSHKSPVVPRSRPGREAFDAAKVGTEVILRHWRPGDRFQPIGMSVPVKLQDLFTNQKIPREQRHDLVVLTTVNGELVWVEALRISERFKLSRATNKCLQWQWKRL